MINYMIPVEGSAMYTSCIQNLIKQNKEIFLRASRKESTKHRQGEGIQICRRHRVVGPRDNRAAADYACKQGL